MEPKLREEMIAQYIRQLDEKEIEISQVRRELEEKHMSDEDIKIVVRAVDAELQRRLTTQQQHKNASSLIWIGLVLMATGVVITVLSSKKIIDIGNRDILSYGPFLGGLALFFIGRSKKLQRSN
jgi:hypothetical protein